MRRKWIVIWIVTVIIVLWGISLCVTIILDNNKRPEAIILIDVTDYDEVKESIFEWFINNDELKNKIDFRVIMTVNADLIVFNPFKFYDELQENTGVKNPIHGTARNWKAAIILMSEWLKKREIFPGKGEKILIILSTQINSNRGEQFEAIKQFQADYPKIKLIMTILRKNNSNIGKPKKVFPFKRKSENLANISDY